MSAEKREGGGILRFVAVSVPRFLLGALGFVGIAINFANVIGRYVFSSPIIWAEEILVYMMIWCLFIGAVVVTWDGRHIKMDMLAERIPLPWRQVVNAIVTLGFVLVCLFVVKQSWTVTSMLFQTGQQSVIARLPMGMVQAAIMTGFALMLLAVLLRLRSYVSGEFPSEAEATAQQMVEMYGSFDGDEKTGEGA